MPNPRAQDRQLDELYARLPKLECQGHCHDSCGPIDMSVRERARIVERARKPITCGPGAGCSMLTADRRCSVYDIRPMICRLWGLVEGLRCPYGCRPDGGLLPNQDGLLLLHEANRIGGEVRGDKYMRMAENILASLSEEELVAAAEEVVGTRFRATLAGRQGALRRAGVKAPFER